MCGLRVIPVSIRVKFMTVGSEGGTPGLAPALPDGTRMSTQECQRDALLAEEMAVTDSSEDKGNDVTGRISESLAVVCIESGDQTHSGSWQNCDVDDPRTGYFIPRYHPSPSSSSITSSSSPISLL